MAGPCWRGGDSEAGTPPPGWASSAGWAGSAARWVPTSSAEQRDPVQEGPRPVSSRRSRPVARGLEEPPTPRLGVLGPRWLQVLGLARLHGAPWRAQVRPPSLQVRPGSTRRLAAAHSQVPTGRISDELGEAGGGPGAWRILGLGPSLRSSAGRGRGLVRVQLRGRVGDPGDADERILSTGIRGHWVPGAQQGRWAAEGGGQGSWEGSWEVGVSTARPHRRPPALLRARHLSLLGKRPEAGRQAEQRRALRARSAPGPCDTSSGWPPPRLWFLRTPGHRLAGGGGSGRSVRPAGRGGARGFGIAGQQHHLVATGRLCKRRLA